MKFQALFRGLTVVLTAYLLLTPTARAATPTVETLVRIGGDLDGFHPEAALIDGGDGNFYGTTEAGGRPNCGTIYKVAPDGTLTTLYSFAGGSDGANPTTALVAGGDGNFYGVTPGTFPLGGPNSGTIYRVTPAGALTTVYRFSRLAAPTYHNADGAFPTAGLIRGIDGNLYGTTQNGGTGGGGTIFRVTLDGTLTTLVDFDTTNSTNPVSPVAALVQGTDGNFYGSTRHGGTSGSGTIFQVTPGGAFTVIYNFTGSGDGGGTANALTLGPDGNFYGTAGSVAFKVTPAGVFTPLHTFARTEGFGLSALTLGKDGNFYGTTNSQGANNDGTVFQLTPVGTVTTLYNFTGAATLLTNLGGNALVVGGDGNLYGSTQGGGNGNAGTLFKVTTAGALTTLHNFYPGGSGSQARLLQVPNGNFFGTTVGGGATGDGTLFACDTDGVMVTLHSYNADVDGAAPAGGLTLAADGGAYGTLSQGFVAESSPASVASTRARRPRSAGGRGSGALAKAEKALLDIMIKEAQRQANEMLQRMTQELLAPKAIEPTCGDSPLGDLIKDLPLGTKRASRPVARGFIPGDNLPLYGVTASGSDFNFGAVYTFDPAGTFTKSHAFTGQPNDGAEPADGLVAAGNGKFYGTTRYGGAHNLGTIYSIALNGGETVVHSFAGTGDGAYPSGALVLGSDGNLYGTTAYSTNDPSTGTGGGNGTIFKLAPDGTLTTLHALAGETATDATEGAQPLGALLMATDGVLYGTTSFGGENIGGTVFSVTTDGTFTVLHNFVPNSGDGDSPQAALIEGTDGNLYGTTTGGGTDGAGVVFRVKLGSTTGPGSTLPVVTLTADVPTVAAGSGAKGRFLLSLSSAATTDLKVAYTLKGNAINGTDYKKLKGTAKIKAGQSTKAIKIVPLGDLDGALNKKVKLTLEEGDGYTVGTTETLKVKIVAGGQ